MMKTMMQGREDDGMSSVPMTLELSADHHIITTLLTIKETNEPVARIAVEQLFDNACIAAGSLDDPRVLLSRLNKVLEMMIYQGAGFDYAKGEYNVSEAGEAATEAKAPESKPEEAKKTEEKPDEGSSKKFEEVKPS